MENRKNTSANIRPNGRSWFLKSAAWSAVMGLFFCLTWGRCGGTVIASAATTQTEEISSVRTLHEIFQTQNPEETMTFPEERDFDGWMGKLETVEYEIIKQEPITQRKTETMEVELPWSETFPRAEAVVEKDGISYQLQNVFVREKPVTDRRAKMEQQVFYRGYMEEPLTANEQNTEYYDEVTGETVQAALPLHHIRKMYTAWKADVFFTLRIEDVTADYYQLGEKIRKMGELPEPAEYPAILSALELDAEKYRIEKIWWADEDCQVIYGQGSRYASDYMAVYEGEVFLPDLPGFCGTAVYSAEWEEETGAFLYTIQASATYREKDAPMNWVGIVGGTVTAGTGLVWIVLFHRRRRKKDS